MINQHRGRNADSTSAMDIGRLAKRGDVREKLVRRLLNDPIDRDAALCGGSFKASLYVGIDGRDHVAGY